MKGFGHTLLSLAAPLLIALALMGLFQRERSDRFQSLPSLVVGCGLILSGALGRRHRRKLLLLAMRETGEDDS